MALQQFLRHSETTIQLVKGSGDFVRAAPQLQLPAQPAIAGDEGDQKNEFAEHAHSGLLSRKTGKRQQALAFIARGCQKAENRRREVIDEGLGVFAENGRGLGTDRKSCRINGYCSFAPPADTPFVNVV